MLHLTWIMLLITQNCYMFHNEEGCGSHDWHDLLFVKENGAGSMDIGSIFESNELQHRLIVLRSVSTKIKADNARILKRNACILMQIGRLLNHRIKIGSIGIRPTFNSLLRLILFS